MNTRRTRLACTVVCTALAALAGCQSGGGGGGGQPGEDRGGGGPTGEMITLSAPELAAAGGAPTYAWTQVSGPPVVLDDPTSRTPSFPVPDVQEATILGFEVEVTSGGTTLTFDVEVVVHPTTADGGGGPAPVPVICGREGAPCLLDSDCCAELVCGELGWCADGGGEAPAIIGNVPPSLTITSPVEDLTVVQGEQFEISWTDSDRDSNALISFALVDASEPDWVVPLVEGLLENDLDANLDWTAQTFTASTELATPGDYYIRGTIDDGVNAPVVTFATHAEPDAERVLLTVRQQGFVPA
ncbi:MAG TPA: hypothetical protein VM243_03430 [Phycisphaerae bacterium]|nr:hypothetical protein [Phycisphaerae bacterium]